MVLLISDDGVGIAPDKLPVILSGEGTSVSGGTNIAIYNTHRRLQVLYGDQTTDFPIPASLDLEQKCRFVFLQRRMGFQRNK